MPPRRPRRTQAEQTELVKNNPEQVMAERQAADDRRLPRLEELFPGGEYDAFRQSVITTGFFDRPNARNRMQVVTRPITTADGVVQHEILAMGAVARDPGLTQDYIDEIQDFLPGNAKTKSEEVEQFWNIYLNEGVINNAINKIAAILSGGGRFKVRKAKKGKTQDAQERLQAALDEFLRKVNNAPLDGVVTGSRGLQAVVHQAIRQTLVEGDWIGRSVWVQHEVPNWGSFNLPMTIQSLSMSQIEAVAELVGTGIEAYYWVPPQALLDQLDRPKTKEIRDFLKRFVPSDVISKLRKDKKVLLDPALLLHVKHRGVDARPFGESFIKPAMQGIAFKRAIEALDIVCMQNLINRLTIVMVGSSDPASPYSKPDVAAARQRLMQQFFEDPGPNMTIVWAGDDVHVADVGAHESVLELDQRHQIAEGKIKISMGVPEALLSGASGENKAAGWAATIGMAAQLEELKNNLENVITTLGERIAFENNFTQFDITFEFDNSLMTDRAEEWNQLRLDVVAGQLSTYTYLAGRGFDPDAEFRRKAYEMGLDPDAEGTRWNQVFVPLPNLPGAGEGAPPGAAPGGAPSAGRPPGNPGGAPAAKPTERKTPESRR
jgi:hypothetical protein